MALLAIDQGNTRTKFGLFEAGMLQHIWTCPTRKDVTPQELSRDIFPDCMLTGELQIGLCTVVPELRPIWQRMAQENACRLIPVTGCTPTILRNAYATPETLGPDRLMAAVAAAQLVGTPVIPVSLGTAMVVDAVSQGGTYLGGMIAPGIGVMADALANAASALEHIDWHEPSAPIGRTSSEAMRNGMFYQSIGGLCAMIDAIRTVLGEDTPVALTGGWANSIAPHLSHIALIDEFLVLHGIAITLQPHLDTPYTGKMTK